MQTFYFDVKDGVPVRDRFGIEFGTASQAIEHSKVLAKQIRLEPCLADPDLEISVINESGHEVHRELVYPNTASSLA